MTTTPDRIDTACVRYERVCRALERVTRPLGINSAKGRARAKDHRGADRSRLAALESDLRLAGIRCDAHSVLAAANGLVALAAIAGIGSVIACIVCLETPHVMAALIVASTCPLLGRQWLLSFASSAAKKRARDIMRTSAGAINLMVMGVRHDSSLPKAMGFASEGDSAFAKELRRCTWEVITGTHTSFEDALYALGCRWERFSKELKTSLNAIIVASHEGTEEGKRRALERANRAMVSGAKRRVEEYALSLSTPSMMLFGLGILLPIMVGSFLPMLSWDIWMAGTDAGSMGGGDNHMFETAIMMDVMFPVVAFLVATDAVSRRPVDEQEHRTHGTGPLTWALSAGAGIAAGICASIVMGLAQGAPLVLLTGVISASTTLILLSPSTREHPGTDEDEVQDLLFRAGARMLDGENFETALYRASDNEEPVDHRLGRRLCVKGFVMGRGFDGAVASEMEEGRTNSLDALTVVERAATKDEAGAGMLAMDLASYLRELSEIELTLKMRLRPTISMMRMTAHALGPVVLGITFAIYMSLGSAAIGGDEAAVTGGMLVVLGVFLAEMNAVVCYFVWGIEGGADTRRLARASGACLLVSQLVFVSTAVLAS